jgi:phage-related protein
LVKKLTARFYQTLNTNMPVREWLLALPSGDRRIIGADIATVEFGWPIGMPICKSVKGGLWEIRSTIRNGRVEARLYFAIDDDQAILLHGHEGKDSQSREIGLARLRWSDYMSRKRKDLKP